MDYTLRHPPHFQRPAILAIGQVLRVEFAAASEQLNTMADVRQVSRVRDVLIKSSLADENWELIVLFHSRPGEHSSAELAQLAACHPITRFVSVLGSWCEGESRTGDPWPGATRVHWHEWPAYAARNFAAHRAGRSAEWSLPLTASDDERWLYRVRTASATKPLARPAPRFMPPPAPQNHAGLIVICARHAGAAEALAGVCRWQGWTTAWQPPDRPLFVDQVDALLWDGSQFDCAEQIRFRAMTTALPRTPVIALFDFPRAETRQQAFEAGAVSVLGKPLWIDDLAWHLAQMAPQVGAPPSAATRAAVSPAADQAAA